VDWRDYPTKLNFQVIPTVPRLINHQHRPGWKNLSRLFDLPVDDNVIVYCDSDVFWLQNPFPLLGDLSKFNFNQMNSGFFYYQPSQTATFLEIFKSFALTAMYDDNFRYLSRQFVDYNEWYYVLDETILSYMFNKHRDLFNIIPDHEHTTARNLANVSQIKMFHCNGLMVSNPLAVLEGEKEHCRGLCGLLFKEVYDNLRLALSENDLIQMFTPEIYEHYLPKQQSLMDLSFRERLLATKSASGHYHLQAALA
jgi:hypothetical protein